MNQSSTQPVNMGVVYLLTAVAALGGLLFGYDTAVISGAIGFLQAKFELTAAMKGWAASSAIIGCIFGAMFAGYMSDRFGRKKILILTAFLFGISAIGSALPNNLTQFAIARFVGGLGPDLRRGQRLRSAGQSPPCSARSQSRLLRHRR